MLKEDALNIVQIIHVFVCVLGSQKSHDAFLHRETEKYIMIFPATQ